MNNGAKQKSSIKGMLMLLSAAFIWGVSFPITDMGMEHVDAFTFKTMSNLIGALALLPVILMRGRKNRETKDKTRKFTRKTVLYGGAIGLAFCIAGSFQQQAFYYSTSGKIAFITAFYMLFVPLIGLMLKKRVAPITWVCVVAGVVGLFFLCVDPGSGVGINKGDVLALIGAVFFAVHILLIEQFSSKADALQLTFVQFAVACVISCVLMFLLEEPKPENILAALFPLLFTGVLGGSLGLALQITGQRYVEATVATLLLCLESVFGVLGGAVLLHEMLSGREILGCVIMFAAIILSQVSGTLTEKLRNRTGQGG